MIFMPSPNYNERPQGVDINSIIIHYTGMKDAASALKHLCNPESKVSAHYTIDEDGTIYSHVHPDDRAWHAGNSEFGEFTNFNDFSIGIELVNPGHDHGYRPFTDEQIDMLVAMIKNIYQLYPIDPNLVLGHSDIAPDRKQDPGDYFPWHVLVEENLAIRPKGASNGFTDENDYYLE
jgi:N-acetylmuramoyl-L-alanine amidase